MAEAALIVMTVIIMESWQVISTSKERHDLDEFCISRLLAIWSDSMSFHDEIEETENALVSHKRLPSS